MFTHRKTASNECKVILFLERFFTTIVCCGDLSIFKKKKAA
jgi:hypothetical protein